MTVSFRSHNTMQRSLSINFNAVGWRIPLSVRTLVQLCIRNDENVVRYCHTKTLSRPGTPFYSTHVCTSHTLISFRSVLTVITKFELSLNRFTTSKLHVFSVDVVVSVTSGGGTSGIRVGNGGAFVSARYRFAAGGYSAICEYNWLPLCIKAGVTVDRNSFRKHASGFWISCAESSSSNYITNTDHERMYKLYQNNIDLIRVDSAVLTANNVPKATTFDAPPFLQFF